MPTVRHHRAARENGVVLPFSLPWGDAIRAAFSTSFKFVHPQRQEIVGGGDNVGCLMTATEPTYQRLINDRDSLRDELSKYPNPGPVSERTYKVYLATAIRLKKMMDSLQSEQPHLTIQDRIACCFTKGASRSDTVRGRRAALIHLLRVTSEKRLAVVERIIEGGLQLYAGELQKGWEYLRNVHEMLGWLRAAVECQPAFKSTQPRSSKSTSLKGLPKNWRERVLGELKQQGHKHWPAVAVLTLTGCRPEEILRGVAVTMDGDHVVRLTIVSAKGGKGALRHISILDGDPFFQIAWELAIANDHVDLGTAKDWRKNDLGDTVRETGEPLFRNAKEGISPYSYRHQLGSDMKKSGYADEVISAAFGHANLRTKTRYGRFGQGLAGRRLHVDTDVSITPMKEVFTPPTNDSTEQADPVSTRDNDDGPAP